jgi:hypothetical protein
MQHVKVGRLGSIRPRFRGLPKGASLAGVAAPSTPEASQICSASSQRLAMPQSWADTAGSHLSTTRWRAETNKLHATLKKSQGEVSQTGEEM